MLLWLARTWPVGCSFTTLKPKAKSLFQFEKEYWRPIHNSRQTRIPTNSNYFFIDNNGVQRQLITFKPHLKRTLSHLPRICPTPKSTEPLLSRPKKSTLSGKASNPHLTPHLPSKHRSTQQCIVKEELATAGNTTRLRHTVPPFGWRYTFNKSL